MCRENRVNRLFSIRPQFFKSSPVFFFKRVNQKRVIRPTTNVAYIHIFSIAVFQRFFKNLEVQACAPGTELWSHAKCHHPFYSIVLHPFYFVTDVRTPVTHSAIDLELWTLLVEKSFQPSAKLLGNFPQGGFPADLLIAVANYLDSLWSGLRSASDVPQIFRNIIGGLGSPMRHKENTGQWLGG